MNDFGDYTDEQVEAILKGSDFPEEDFALASFVTEVRTVAIEPVDADLARRHVAMLAEAAHLNSSSIRNERRVDGRPDGPAEAVTTFTARRRRLVTKSAVVGLAAVLMGGSIAAAATGSLPVPAQSAIAGLAAHIGIDLPSGDADLGTQAAAGPSTATADQAFAGAMVGNDDRFAEAVQDAIGGYPTAMDVWTDCVAYNALGLGSTQGDLDPSPEDEFDAAEGCGEKPNLVIASPADVGLGSAEEAGAFEDAGVPDDAGASDDDGAFEDAGPPANDADEPPPGGDPPGGLP